MEQFGLSDQIDGISKIHGMIFEGKDDGRAVRIIPLYHPVVAVYNKNMIENLKKDFKILNQKVC